MALQTIAKLIPTARSLRVKLTVYKRHDFTSEELKSIYHESPRRTFFTDAAASSRHKREQDTFWSNPVSIVIRKEWIVR